MVIIRSHNTYSVYKLLRFKLKGKTLKRCLVSEAIPQKNVQENESIHSGNHKPSFAKNLFLGIFDRDILTYPEVFTIEHFNTINNTLKPVEQYFKGKVVSKDIVARANLPEDVIKQLKAFNLCGLRIPKEYGGQGLNATEYARFCEVIALDSSASLLVAAHQSLGVQSLLISGSEEQKQKYLPKLASGELLATFCMSENVSGSDLASIETTAQKHHEDENLWCLNGKKQWITNGTNANIFTVLAQTVSKTQFGELKGISAFIVEKDYPGVTISKPTNMIGVKGVDVNEVTFKDVVVPEANLLGEVGSGFKLAIDVLNSNRFATGANTVALLKELFGKVTEHIIHRKQYSSNLVDCEQVQKQFAKVALTIYALESMTYLTAGLHDQFQNYDGSVENSIIKAYAIENGQKCINICLDLLGARSCVEDHPYEKYSRDFKTMSIVDGALDVTKLYIVSMGLHHSSTCLQEDVKKVRNPLDYPGYIFKRMFRHRKDTTDDPKLTLKLYLELHPHLLGAAKQLEYCVLRLQFAVTYLFGEHGADIMNHQVDLMRLASVVLDVYAMTAVLGRASRAYCTGIAQAEDEIILAQKYCYDCFKRVKNNVNNIFEGIEKTGDIFYFKIAEDVFKNRGYFLRHPTERNI